MRGRRTAAWPILGCLAIYGCPSGQRGASDEMDFAFEHYQTQEQAKQALLEQLPPGTPRRAVQEFVARLPHTTVTNGPDYIACRHLEKSMTMVHTVWSAGFYFNERRLLEKIEVSRGLVGP